MKQIRVTLAFHNRTESLVVEVAKGEDLRRLKNELETQPRVVKMEEVGGVSSD